MRTLQPLELHCAKTKVETCSARIVMQVWCKSPEYLLLMFDSISLRLHLRDPFRIRVDILSFSPDHDNGPGDQLSQWQAGNGGTYQAVRVAFHKIVATALTLRLQIIKSWRELHEKKNERLSQGITPIVPLCF